MTTERCPYCSRALDSISRELGVCRYCENGLHTDVIAHAKAVRMAWKYRAITRRRCDGCKWASKNGGIFAGPYSMNLCRGHHENKLIYSDAQCPRFEKQEENTKC